ncbi:MAG: plasmid recombination protein [Clostridia bacterium]
MSYAIVRNEKLTRAEINGKGTHNDRKAKNHTNKDIKSNKNTFELLYQEK